MSDDNKADLHGGSTAATNAIATTTARQTPSGAAPAAPPGYSLRRSMTVGEGSSFSHRRGRPFSPAAATSATSAASAFDNNLLRRRSSTFSDYSLGDARDIFNPGTTAGGFNKAGTGASASSGEESSNWDSVPLAFALLPALGGILFKNGSAMVTDVMLLGLAAVFLHWSVTQPWSWYHSAQRVRIREEGQLGDSTALYSDEESSELGHVEEEEEEEEEEEGKGREDDDREKQQHQQRHPSTPSPAARQTQSQLKDKRNSTNTTTTTAAAAGTPSRTSPHQSPRSPRLSASRAASRSDALSELYLHETLALAACFLCPAAGAYLLHAIRAQLTRPSEGLVSNYNLTIFLLASELRPLSHLVKLVHSRTLHLQRIVHENPYVPRGVVAEGDLSSLLSRIEVLESASGYASGTGSAVLAGKENGEAATAAAAARNTDVLAREVRASIQPDLDALNRAVRRYEKKATLLSLQTESRFGAMEMKLGDAVALAAAAAKNSANQMGFLQWAAVSLAQMVLLPFRGITAMLLLPFRMVTGLVKGGRGKKSDRERERERERGKGRMGKEKGGSHGGGSGSRIGERSQGRLSRRG